MLRKTSQSLKCLIQRAMQFIHSRSFLSNVGGVEVGNDGKQKIHGAPDALSGHVAQDFFFRLALQLKLAEFLRDGGSLADEVHGIEIFFQEAKVDALGPKQSFELLEFDRGFFDLQIHSPETTTDYHQLDDDSIMKIGPRSWSSQYTSFDGFRGKEIGESDTVAQVGLPDHFDETAALIDYFGDGGFLDGFAV